MAVKGGSVGHRILVLLTERWPVTTDDIALALGLRPGAVALEVKRLSAKGRVNVERLGGKTYVVLRSDARQFPKPAPKDPEDPAFG